MRAVFTEQTMAVVLQRLSEQSTLPVLLMRVVIKSTTAYPKLKPFVIDILHTLVRRKVSSGSLCTPPHPHPTLI